MPAGCCVFVMPQTLQNVYPCHEGDKLPLLRIKPIEVYPETTL